MFMFNFPAGTTHSRVTSVGRPAKSSIKRVQASQTSVQPEKHDIQKTKAARRRVVIPTARPDDTGRIDFCIQCCNVMK